MYPFERFTERAKKVLTLAQEEAERAHHSYIGTEHLLLGLLRDSDGLAAKVLANLGIGIDQVRATIESVLGRNERVIIQQIIPTSRVKKVIEIAFEEARRMGHNYVGTEHMLLALLIEGEGIAAHVLIDLGVTLERVRAEIESLLLAGPTAEPAPGGHAPHVGYSDEVSLAIRLAGTIALSLERDSIEPEHLRMALDLLGTPEVQRLLDLGAEIRGLEATKRDAIARQDFEAAARARDTQRQAREEFALAEDAWKRTLKRRRKRN